MSDKLHHHDDSKSIFGFWIYIMSDCILFACLFATYVVLKDGTFGGPTPKQIFNMRLVLAETFILLTSSFTYGLAMLDLHKHKIHKVIFWLMITFVLGAMFISIELTEFSSLIHEGNGFQRSAFLSSFFALVGTHGLHVTFGLIWMIVVIIQLLRNKITPEMTTKLTMLSLFWHFLDIVWIFVFTTVYLLGVL